MLGAGDAAATLSGDRPIMDFMTSGPHAVDCRNSIAEATEAMAALGVHHLPVTDRGALVGIVSARDLDRLQACKPNVEAEVLAVFEAMTPEPYTVGPRTPLSRVVAHMAEDGLDAAVVVDHQAVIGIFTAHDAMRLLAELLE